MFRALLALPLTVTLQAGSKKGGKAGKTEDDEEEDEENEDGSEEAEEEGEGDGDVGSMDDEDEGAEGEGGEKTPDWINSAGEETDPPTDVENHEVTKMKKKGH